MSEKVKKDKKPRKKLSRSAIVLITGIVIIAIPCIILAGILISSAINTGTPVFGDRYLGDLDPAISEDDMTAIQEEVMAFEGVEAVEVNLPSGQLRVNVDVNDEMSSEDIEALVDTVYETVIARLPIDTYFTSSDTRKMYDLSINVYNFTSTDEGLIYYELTKNAMMDEPTTQLVSEPIDPELVDQIVADQNPEETTDDVSGE